MPRRLIELIVDADDNVERATFLNGCGDDDLFDAAGKIAVQLLGL